MSTGKKQEMEVRGAQHGGISHLGDQRAGAEGDGGSRGGKRGATVED